MILSCRCSASLCFQGPGIQRIEVDTFFHFDNAQTIYSIPSRGTYRKSQGQQEDQRS